MYKTLSISVYRIYFDVSLFKNSLIYNKVFLLPLQFVLFPTPLSPSYYHRCSKPWPAGVPTSQRLQDLCVRREYTDACTASAFVTSPSSA